MFDQLHDQGQTIIVVTHEEHIARHAERIISMKDGQISSDLLTDKNPADKGRMDNNLRKGQR